MTEQAVAKERERADAEMAALQTEKDEAAEASEKATSEMQERMDELQEVRMPRVEPAWDWHGCFAEPAWRDWLRCFAGRRRKTRRMWRCKRSR